VLSISKLNSLVTILKSSFISAIPSKLYTTTRSQFLALLMVMSYRLCQCSSSLSCTVTFLCSCKR
jgi:hypothetical protein